MSAGNHRLDNLVLSLERHRKVHLHRGRSASRSPSLTSWWLCGRVRQVNLRETGHPGTPPSSNRAARTQTAATAAGGGRPVKLKLPVAIAAAGTLRAGRVVTPGGCPACERRRAAGVHLPCGEACRRRGYREIPKGVGCSRRGRADCGQKLWLRLRRNDRRKVSAEVSGKPPAAAKAGGLSWTQ